MTTGKIAFALGSLSFSSEGEPDWVIQQMNAFVARVPELAKLSNAPIMGQQRSNNTQGDTSVTLASFIRSTASTDNQTRKFLATAEWLHMRGHPRITTSAVVKALRESSQKGLSNPSDCLNKNVGKGFCEKVGNEFFATDEGRASLGGDHQ